MDNADISVSAKETMTGAIEKTLGEARCPLDSAIAMVNWWGENSISGPDKINRILKDVIRICNKLSTYEKHSLKRLGSTLSGFATNESAVYLCAWFDTPDPNGVRARLIREL